MVTTRNKKDFNNGKHQILFLDLDSGEQLYLQGLPKEHNVNPDTLWAYIRPFGRNNSYPFFVGSDDTINFDISWYSELEDRSDVIEKCKWLESMTKADGYLGRPHYIALIWGELYRNQRFILQSAPYRLTDFHAEHGYKPVHAVQQITLRRVTENNLTHKEILDYR